MCLLVFAKDVHPDYKLILAANRDEFYKRPTQPAHYWKEYPEVLAGKDLEAGGTWLGITKTGRFAAITNYRDLKNIKKDAPSRGKLTLNFLINSLTPEEYYNQIKTGIEKYNGFNLIFGTTDNLYYLSNISKEFKKLEPGIYGLSNSLLDTPWHNVQRSKEKFKKIINSKNDFNTDDLLTVLSDKEPADENQLPETGLNKEIEKAISAIFVKTDFYGTRSSTILTIDKNNNVKLVEKNFDKKGNADRTDFEFEII